MIALRLGNQHKVPGAIREIITTIRKYPGSVDSVWLTTEFGLPPLEIHRQNALLMREAAGQFRQEGISITLQIANTIGHGVFMKSQSFEGVPSSACMVIDDGTANPYCFCPRNSDFLTYIREFVKLYAEASVPDIVFIDDDLRLDQDLRYGCFCDDCMSAFNDSYNHNFIRKDLVDKVNDPDDVHVREQWFEFCGQSIAGVARAVAESVRIYSANAAGGLEHGGDLYSDNLQVYEALRDVFGRPPHDRPGGGIYNDHIPRDLIRKALLSSLLKSRLPDYVADVVPEIENYPHVALGKSIHGTMIESALHLSYGCTGLTYATLVFDNEPIQEYEAMFARISAWRSYFEQLIDWNDGTEAGGCRIAVSKRQRFAPYKDCPPFAWADWGIAIESERLVQIGLPVSYTASSENLCYILDPAMSDQMSDTELRELFCGKVITCGETLTRLTKRGLSHLTGVSASLREEAAEGEMLTDDPLNGEKPHKRFCYNLGGNIRQYVFSCNQKYRSLAQYYLKDGSLAESSALITETPCGGKLAVFGYQMWNPILSSSKRTQILNAADELTGNTMPAIIRTPAQAVCIPRVRKSDGALRALTVLNESIDRTSPLQIVIRNPAGRRARLLRPMQNDISLPIEKIGGNLILTLPEIESWQICTVVFDVE